MAMKAEGTSDEEARGRIWMVDSKGLIVKNRPEGGLNEHKEKFAKDHPPVRTLTEVVNLISPSVLIGKSIPTILHKLIANQLIETAGRPK